MFRVSTLFFRVVSGDETANPELQCRKNQPAPVLEIDGASETGFEKGSFGGPGVGKLGNFQEEAAINGQPTWYPEKRSSFLFG